MTLPLLALTALNTLLLTEILTNEGDPPLQNNESVGDPLRAPYTPPFTGGQCIKSYSVVVRLTQRFSDNRPDQQFNLTVGAIGKIIGTRIDPSGNSTAYLISNSGNTETELAGGGSFPGGSFAIVSAQIISVAASDGIDNCGDLPNQNPSIGDNNNGLYQNEDEYSPELIKEGLAPLPIAALLTAAIAALEAAQTIADLAAAIADLIEAINRIQENDKSKERGEHFRLFRLNIGNVNRDGLIQINKFENGNGTEKPLTLEVEFTSIPQGFGRFFGQNSPNRFIYQSLGYIAFVSANYGVIETHACEFPRHSFNIPENAIGFYFHFGLIGNVRANLSAIIQQEIETE